MALTGRVLGADEALDWGLVAEVVDDPLVPGHAAAIADQLAAGPAHAFAETKRLIRSSWDAPAAERPKDEADTIARAVAGGEAAELVEAFAGSARAVPGRP